MICSQNDWTLLSVNISGNVIRPLLWHVLTMSVWFFQFLITFRVDWLLCILYLLHVTHPLCIAFRQAFLGMKNEKRMIFNYIWIHMIFIYILCNWICVNLFIHLSSVTAFTWSGLQWIQKHFPWAGNTPWMGWQFITGHMFTC